MKRSALLAGLPLMAGCVLPDGVTQDDVAAFDAAVASVGCDLGTEREFIAVGFQTGIPRETLVEIAQYQLSLDRALPLSNGGVRLVTGACAPDPEVSA